MKKVIKILMLGFLVILGSCSDNAISKEEIVNSNVKNNNLFKTNSTDDEIIVYGFPDQRGEAGPGYWGPNTVGFNNCNKKNGECVYQKSFGGNGDPLWKAKYLENEKIRLEYIIDIIAEEILWGTVNNNNNFIWYNTPGMPGGETTLEFLANFIENHYNIPRFFPFHESINTQFLEIMGLPEGSQIYTVPGEYEIIKNSEHPNGYFDLQVFVQLPGEDAPPSPPFTDVDCIPVWYNNQWNILCQ